MDYWWDVYSRSRWQDEFAIIGQFEHAQNTHDFMLKYADDNPSLEVSRNSVCGQYLFDNEHIISEGKSRTICRDYAAFYENSGGMPPLRFPKALADWSIGFDSDFNHRIDKAQADDLYITWMGE